MRYERPNTQYATRWSLPPMLAHLLFCRGLYAVVRSTSVEIALQIHSILTNKPNLTKGQN